MWNDTAEFYCNQSQLETQKVPVFTEMRILRMTHDPEHHYLHFAPPDATPELNFETHQIADI